jgi:hypothetical protein
MWGECEGMWGEWERKTTNRIIQKCESFHTDIKSYCHSQITKYNAHLIIQFLNEN